MTLRIVTPDGMAGETACDSVSLLLRDDTEGKKGGSVGIWKDHAPAVMALGSGPVTASLRGTRVLETSVYGGFASVRDNTVTVITDRAEASDGAGAD